MSFSLLTRNSSLSSSFQVVHGDICLKNILIRHSDRTLKLIDFGSSHIDNGDESEAWRPLRPDSGKINLFAPPPNEPMSVRSDAWSCGVVLYVMAMGLLPFSGRSLQGHCDNTAMTLYIPQDKSDGTLSLLPSLYLPLTS